MNDEWNTLYRAFDATGILLYVGVSSSPLMRIAQHSAMARWSPYVASMTFERFPTRVEVEEAEITAILSEKPVFNIRHAVDVSASFAYLEARFRAGQFVDWPPPKTLRPRVSRQKVKPEVKPEIHRWLLSPEDLAERWSCSKEEARKVISRYTDRVTTYSIHRRRRYKAEDVDLLPEREIQAALNEIKRTQKVKA